MRQPPENIFSRLTGSQAAAGLAVLSWLILYLPVYLELSQAAWTRDENAHAPLMLAVIAGAMLVRLNRLLKARVSPDQFSPSLPVFLSGFVLVTVSALALFLGRVEQFELLATASQLPMLAGFILCLGGVRLLKLLWFPVLMMAYLIVWPGWAIDQVTAPLKLWISSLVAEGLSLFGLPVAHSGVTLAIGPYQLLIADACAGLNSLLSLTAIGAIYLYIARKPGRLRNLTVLLATLPLAILANFIRVTLLVLITWFWGYDAGQGFLHMLAGFVMFAVALGGVFLVDALLDVKWSRLFRQKPQEALA